MSWYWPGVADNLIIRSGCGGVCVDGRRVQPRDPPRLHASGREVARGWAGGATLSPALPAPPRRRVPSCRAACRTGTADRLPGPREAGGAGAGLPPQAHHLRRQRLPSRVGLQAPAPDRGWVGGSREGGSRDGGSREARRVGEGRLGAGRVGPGRLGAETPAGSSAASWLGPSPRLGPRPAASAGAAGRC